MSATAAPPPFEINVPENLTFQDYLAIHQTARVWADGYDLKVSFAPPLFFCSVLAVSGNISWQYHLFNSL